MFLLENHWTLFFWGKLREIPLWVETQYYLLYFPLLNEAVVPKSGLHSEHSRSMNQSLNSNHRGE